VFEKTKARVFSEAHKQGYEAGWEKAIEAFGDVIFDVPPLTDNRIREAIHHVRIAEEIFASLKISEPVE
jgi:hypothetical protein